jgi:hypothetical protein
MGGVVAFAGAGVSEAAGRCSPWRVAKWHLRKGDMMALGRPMGGAGR